MRSMLIGVAATLALASTLRADTPIVKTEAVEETATIEAIDRQLASVRTSRFPSRSPDSFPLMAGR